MVPRNSLIKPLMIYPSANQGAQMATLGGYPIRMSPLLFTNHTSVWIVVRDSRVWIVVGRYHAPPTKRGHRAGLAK